jgi:hypothetical protein
MPEYKQPLQSRQLSRFLNSASLPEIFPKVAKNGSTACISTSDGHGLRPLSVHWVYGGPAGCVRRSGRSGLGSPKARPICSLTRQKKDRVPKNFGKTELKLAVEEASTLICRATQFLKVFRDNFCV